MNEAAPVLALAPVWAPNSDAQRAQGAAARAALTLALARLHPELSADRWTLERRADGRPRLLHPELPRGPFVSLAHTGGLGVALVDPLAPVGVDVERCDRRVRVLALADRWFPPRERALLMSREGDERRQLFLRLWVLKEALAKQLSCGLPSALGTPILGEQGALVLPVSAAGGSRWHLAQPEAPHLIGLLCRAGAEIVSTADMELPKLLEPRQL